MTDIATAPLRNWAGNVTFTATALHQPTSVEELQELVARSNRLRVLGSGHSFNHLADTTGTMVGIRGLPPFVDLDAATGQARVAAGMTYGAVGTALQQAGRALHNTGSLPHISVAGACSTGTHGSGDTNQILPTAVTAVAFVRADGELQRLSRAADPAVFDGAVLALGMLGVVVELTLATEPTYQVRQDVWRDVPFPAVRDRFAEVMAAGHSVSVFTDWSRPDVVDKVWVKRRTDRFTDLPVDWLGGQLSATPAHPLEGEDPAAATEQLGRPGPWNARLPHFRLEFTPSNGDEIQSEYLLERHHAAGALDALRGLAGLFPGVLQVCEVRTVAADGLWLSPASGRDSVALHFTWINDIDRVTPVLARVEAALEPWEPRPHWGKVFTSDTAVVRSRYPRLDDFLALAGRFDPEGVFRNETTDHFVGSPG